MGRNIIVALCLLHRLMAASDPIIIGSKPFTESYVLAEIMAQLIERETDLDVERRFGMQGTFTSFTAISHGSIHIYPEYTGTGAYAILKSDDPAQQTLDSLRAKFQRRWGLTWLEPWGFDNTWAVVVRQSFAREHNLSTMSDLAKIPRLDAAFTHEFMERVDGYPGMQAVYGFPFKSVRGIQHILAYDALLADDIQVTDAYATDGEIARYALLVLEDDRRFFPEYLAAPLVRLETLRQHPELRATLNRLAGMLSGQRMQQVNRAAAEAGDDYPAVVTQLLDDLLGAADHAQPGISGWSRLATRTGRHLILTGVAVVAAIAFALPLGMGMVGKPVLARLVLAFASIVQTIPSIAMLGFLIPVLGIGVPPAIAALFIYSLLPIIRNTYTGIRDISPALLEVADGLGMTRHQRLAWLELPLAAPIIFAGIRTAAVISVGTATLAAFIGAGGLGESIVQGLSFNDPRMILSGAIPAAALAIIVDGLLGWLEHRFSTPD